MTLENPFSNSGGKYSVKAAKMHEESNQEKGQDQDDPDRSALPAPVGGGLNISGLRVQVHGHPLAYRVVLAPTVRKAA